ncbi:MAG: hypothetical protein K8S56_00645, partial [Candidatus Cloacimonetes bacterium]|nr:hypothetical protein [Candidatus Cloacimonadota bacterium]
QQAGIFCYIRSMHPAFLFDKLNPQFFELKPVALDFGLVQKNWADPDIPASLRQLEQIRDSKGAIIRRETSFIKENKIDMIVGDIPHLAFLIAKQAGIPSVAVSNFDWHFIYRDIFPNTPRVRSLLNDISQAYKEATLALRLPFSSPESMNAFNHVIETPLLARIVPRNNPGLRQRLNISPEDKIVLLTFGGYDDNPIDMNSICSVPGFVILSQFQNCSLDRFRKVSKEEDFPQLLSSADVVITKTGYSTLAEVVQTGAYLICATRLGSPEDAILLNGLKNYSRKTILDFHQLPDVDWQKMLSALELSPARRFPVRNTEVAVNCLKAIPVKNPRYAVLDVGTNNIQMLWAEIIDGKIVTRHRASQVSALGKNMRNGKLTLAGITRTRRILTKFLKLAKAWTDKIIVTGTSCSRDAKNIKILTNWLQYKFGLDFRILTTEEEAHFSARYIAAEFSEHSEVITFDIGGGSVEFCYIINGEVKRSVSFRCGLRRMETLFGTNIKRQQVYMRDELAPLKNWKFSKLVLIGIGGTATSLAAISKKQIRYSPEDVHKSEISFEEIDKFVELFARSDNATIARMIPFEPLRSSLILSGTILVREIMSVFNHRTFQVSDHSLQYGVLWNELTNSLV